MRHRRTVSTLGPIVAVLLALQAAPALAVEDTTPPVGTLTIEGGAAYTNDRVVVLDVPASDDVGVTIVRARLSGLAWTDFAYAPQVTFDFTASGVVEQLLTIQVEWQDAAGNTSSAQGTIWYDKGPPILTAVYANSQGAPGHVRVHAAIQETGSGIAAARFSTNAGATWGSEVATDAQGELDWDARDPVIGGKAGWIGPLTIHVKFRDKLGQWSAVKSTTVDVQSVLSIDISPNATTGQPVTFTARWDAPINLPANSICMWEFMWGDDQSINFGNRDDTFGYLMTQGPINQGFCTAWTFTLPWTPVRRYLVALSVRGANGVTLGDSMLGGDVGQTAFTSSVGSTSKSITSSSLPMFYVLPDQYSLTVGVPASYHAYALGGAKIKSTDYWSVEYENVPERSHGSANLTFTPKHSGYLTVCLYREGAYQIGACYDPPVKRSSGSGSGSGSGGGGSGGSGGGSGSATEAAGASTEPSVGPSGDAATDAPTDDPGRATQPPDVAVASAAPTPSTAPPGVLIDSESGTGNPAIGLVLGVVLLAGAAVWAARNEDVRRRIRSLRSSRRG